MFGITFFATKNSPNQPKLCEVPRWWNHKKHVFFSYFGLLGPPISLHMFCLKTSSGLQNCPFGRQYVFFFVRCRFTCLAYLGGLSFDFCECFTLFNDEALNFLTFYTQTAKAVCDACTLLPCSPIYLQGGLGGTNEPQVCDATPKRFFICVLWKTSIFHQKTVQAVRRTLMVNSQNTLFFLVFFSITRMRTWFLRVQKCASGNSPTEKRRCVRPTHFCTPHDLVHTWWNRPKSEFWAQKNRCTRGVWKSSVRVFLCFKLRGESEFLGVQKLSLIHISEPTRPY